MANSAINRRDFLAGTAGTLLTAAFTGQQEKAMAQMRQSAPGVKAVISLVRSRERRTAVGRALSLLQINPVIGAKVLLKPNFNTADPFPASTHNDTLAYFLMELQKMGARQITIGERCGPPKTSEVLRNKGIGKLCAQCHAGLINFEELPESDWVRLRPEGSHWRDGFDVARPVLEAERVVSTCCLKTHGYGGIFTMSLKLAVGMTHKDNMRELHTSFRSMRKMIAEINLAYAPVLILMDGIETFVDGGPMHGVKKSGNVMLAGSDRIAMDAVGLAILKDLGANKEIMDRKIFEQEQISRAVELGLGVKRPQDIEIVTDDPESRAYADRLREILRQEAG